MAEKKEFIRGEDIKTMRKDLAHAKGGDMVEPSDSLVTQKVVVKPNLEDIQKEAAQRERMEALQREIAETENSELYRQQEAEIKRLEALKKEISGTEKPEKMTMADDLAAIEKPAEPEILKQKPPLEQAAREEIEKKKLEEEIKGKIIAEEKKRREEQIIKEELERKKKIEAEVSERLKMEEQVKREIEKREKEKAEKELRELEEKRRRFEEEEKKRMYEKRLEEEARHRAIEEERNRREEEERARLENPAVRRGILVQSKKSFDLEKSKIERELKKITIEKDPLDSPKEVLLKEISDIERVSKSIVEREAKVEEQKKILEEKEMMAKTPKERRQIEKERQALEEKRKELEERRWPWDDKIKQAQDKLRIIDSKLVFLDMAAEELEKKKNEIAEEEEKINLELEALDLKETLKKIQFIKKSIEDTKDSLLMKISDAEARMAEISNTEKQIEEDEKLVEEEEMAMKDIDERRRLEKERWQIAQKRKAIEEERWKIEEEKNKSEIQLKKEEGRFQNFIDKASRSLERIKEIEAIIGLRVAGKTDLETELEGEGRFGYKKEEKKEPEIPSAKMRIETEKPIEAKTEIISEKIQETEKEEEPKISSGTIETEIIEEKSFSSPPPSRQKEPSVVLESEEIKKEPSDLKNRKEKSTEEKLEEEKAIEEAKKRIESLKTGESLEKSSINILQGHNLEAENIAASIAQKPETAGQKKQRQIKEEEASREDMLLRVQSPQKTFGGRPIKPPTGPSIPEMSPIGKSLPRKTSITEKKWVRIFAFVLVLVLLFGNVTFWYWFLWIRTRPPVTPVECFKDADCPPDKVCGVGGICQSPPLAKNCTANSDCNQDEICNPDGVCIQKQIVVDIPSPLFEADDKREIKISEMAEIPSIVKQAISEWQNEDKFRQITIINTKENRVITLKDFFDALDLRAPDGFFEKLESNFTLFIYTSQPEGGRIGFVAKAIESQSLAAMLSSQEITMKEDYKPLFSMMNAGIPSDITFFRNASVQVGYTGPNFRFLTLAKNDLGICYFVDSQNFVFASSFKSIGKTLTKLSVAVHYVEITEELKKGSVGEQVKLLQSWLASDPIIYPQKIVNGTFGSLTTEAVKRFQEKYASEILVPQGMYQGNGVVDLYTRIKLNELYANSGIMPKAVELITDLRYGDHRDEVILLQTWLAKDNDIYPSGKVTGWFGALTREAVNKFQQKYASEILSPQGLTKPTGFVDALTRQKLNQLYGNK